MLDEQDGQVELLPQVQDERLEFEGFLRVHARGGFVEQQHGGIGRQSAGDLQTALCSVGQVPGLVLIMHVQAHLAQQFIAAVDGSLFFGLGARVLKDRSGDARRRAAMASDHDVFEHGHAREQADVLERAGHAERRDLVGLHAVEGRGAGGLAVALGQVKLDGPFGGQIDAGDAVEERGLPRAVGADKRDDLLPVDREIHLVERAQAAEIFGQVGYFEHRGVHAWPPVAGTSKADLELSILSLFVILYVRFSPEMRP